MERKRSLDGHTVEELRQHIYLKQRRLRQRRWQRLKEEGRVVNVAGLSPPSSDPLHPPVPTNGSRLEARDGSKGSIAPAEDKLSPGDEIIVSTEIKTYTYIVRKTQVVAPTETWLLEATDYASVTLISCYPYRVNTKRIVVFADLAQS